MKPFSAIYKTQRKKTTINESKKWKGIRKVHDIHAWEEGKHYRLKVGDFLKLTWFGDLVGWKFVKILYKQKNCWL